MTEITFVVEHTLSLEEAQKRRVPFSYNLGLNLGWHRVLITWNHEKDPLKATFEYKNGIEIKGIITIRPRAVVIIAESPHTARLYALEKIEERMKKITERSFAEKLLPLARLT